MSSSYFQPRSGDADLGGLTWGPGYELGRWVSPANGGSRSISFGYDGAHWIEIGRTIVDVPN